MENNRKAENSKNLTESVAKLRVSLFRLLDFSVDLSGDDVPEHDEVAGKAVKRVFESGRIVFLKEEISRPCKAVADNRHGKNEPPRLCCQGNNEKCDDQACAREMQCSAAQLAVLVEVIWVKFFDRFEMKGLHQKLKLKNYTVRGIKCKILSRGRYSFVGVERIVRLMGALWR